MRSAIIPELQWGEEEGETGDLHVTSPRGAPPIPCPGDGSIPRGRAGWVDPKKHDPAILGRG